VINGLVDAGLLKAVANPMHVRSPLMMLTPKGEKEARDIAEREEALMAQLQIAASPQRMADAAAVLQSVRQAIEQQLPALLARAESRKSRR
jgi:DNA-binding MarR family transcriptional regulator